MVFYNIRGGVMFVLAVLAGWGADVLAGGDDINFHVVGALCLVMDLAWRATRGRAALEAEDAGARRLPARMRRRTPSKAFLVHPNAGGHVFFVPLWCAAIGIFLVFLLDL